MAEAMPFETARQRKKRKGTGRPDDGFEAMTKTEKKFIMERAFPEIPKLGEDEFPLMKKVKLKKKKDEDEEGEE